MKPDATPVKARDRFESPVFVVGSSRSGTSLLYAILQSTGVFPIYPAETFFVERGQSRYGDARKESVRRRFLDAWVNTEQFRRSGLDGEAFKRKAMDIDSGYVSLLRLFMESLAHSQQKHRWAEKTPSHIFHLPLLDSGFTDARFIHVVRDGRDVAISKQKLGWANGQGKDTIARLVWGAKSWEYSVRSGRQAQKTLGSRYLEIRYEDLVLDQDRVLGELGRFLNIEVNRDMLEHSEVGSLGSPNSAFSEGAGSGAVPSAVSRWRRELDAAELAALQLVIGDTLSAFGYPLEPTADALSLKDRNRIRILSAWLPVKFALRRALKLHTPLGRLMAADIGVYGRSGG